MRTSTSGEPGNLGGLGRPGRPGGEGNPAPASLRLKVMETAVIITMARKDFVRITAPFSTVGYFMAKKTGRPAARHCMKVALVTK